MIFEILQPQKQELNFYDFPLGSSSATLVLEAPTSDSRPTLFCSFICPYVHGDSLLSLWNHTSIYFLHLNHISFLITTFRLILSPFSCLRSILLLDHSYHPLILTPVSSVPIHMLPTALGFPSSDPHFSRTPRALSHCKCRAFAACRSLCLHLFIPTCFLLTIYWVLVFTFSGQVSIQWITVLM